MPEPPMMPSTDWVMSFPVTGFHISADQTFVILRRQGSCAALEGRRAEAAIPAVQRHIRVRGPSRLAPRGPSGYGPGVIRDHRNMLWIDVAFGSWPRAISRGSLTSCQIFFLQK